jgi:hypothetical protein
MAYKLKKTKVDESIIVKIDEGNKELVLSKPLLQVQGLSEQVDKIPNGWKYQFRFKTDLKHAVRIIKYKKGIK